MSDDLVDRVEQLEAENDALRERLEQLEADVEARGEATARHKEATRGRFWELEDTIEELERELADLAQVVCPDPSAVDFQQLTPQQEVFMIRRALIERASTRDGKVRLTYNEVETLFNQQMATGTIYKRMRQAGELDGFEYDSRDEGKNRVTVDIGLVNDRTMLSFVNNRSTSEVA